MYNDSSMDQTDFKNLLRLLKLIGGKFIIVEDGVPKAVLMDFKEFEDLAVPAYAGKLAQKLAAAEEVNQEITRAQLLDLREEVIQEELTVEPLDV